MVVKICGVPHKVIEKDDTLSLDTHLGLIDYAKAEISINKDMPVELKEETLCHEIVHGMLFHIGRADLSEDETFVQSLGNAIYQTFEVRKES